MRMFHNAIRATLLSCSHFFRLENVVVVKGMDNNVVPGRARLGNGWEDQLRREFQNMGEREIQYRMSLMQERLDIIRATNGGYQMINHLDNSPLERGIGTLGDLPLRDIQAVISAWCRERESSVRLKVTHTAQWTWMLSQLNMSSCWKVPRRERHRSLRVTAQWLDNEVKAERCVEIYSRMPSSDMLQLMVAQQFQQQAQMALGGQQQLPMLGNAPASPLAAPNGALNGIWSPTLGGPAQAGAGMPVTTGGASSSSAVPLPPPQPITHSTSTSSALPPGLGHLGDPIRSSAASAVMPLQNGTLNAAIPMQNTLAEVAHVVPEDPNADQSVEGAAAEEAAMVAVDEARDAAAAKTKAGAKAKAGAASSSSAKSGPKSSASSKAAAKSGAATCESQAKAPAAKRARK